MHHRLFPFILALFASLGPFVFASSSPSLKALSLEDLNGLEKDIQTIAKHCSAATVSLIGNGEGGKGAGSGVVVSEDGLILTAAHVLSAMGDEVTVHFPDGREVIAIPLGADYDRDAGMLKIRDKGEYPFVPLGDSTALLRNQWCLATGHPGGFDPERTPPLRLGRVLVNGDFILTDCVVVGGDSGGPIFDTQGKLIGIHSSIGFTLSENRHVPVSVYKESWKDLESGKRSGDRFAEKKDCRKPDCKNCRAGSVADNASEESASAEVDEGGRDALDRFLDKSMNGATGQMELRLTPEDIQRFGGIDAIMARVKTRTGEVEDADETTAPGDNELGDTGAGDEGTTRNPENGPSGSPMDLAELMRQSRENGGRLEVTPEKLEQLGGISGLVKQLEELGVTGNLNDLSGVALPEGFHAEDTFYSQVVQALKPVTERAASRVGSVHVDGVLTALATVVSKQGHLLTPASQLGEGTLAVKIAGRTLAARVVKQYEEYDLALLATEASDLQPVEWATSPDAARLGTLLTAPGADTLPMGVGLVSVEERNTLSKGYLGVATVNTNGGALVKQVTPDSPAALAGLEEGDVICKIAGESIRQGNIGKVVQGYAAGDRVEVTFMRDKEAVVRTVALAPRDVSMQPERFRMMNRMSGELSKHQSGFPEALQHDIPLSPEECGGPLFSLNGRCVGINVSRAGRVKTLAIPALSIQELIKDDVKFSPHRKL